MFEIQNYASFLLVILMFQIATGLDSVAIHNATAHGGSGVGYLCWIGRRLLRARPHIGLALIGFGIMLAASHCRSRSLPSGMGGTMLGLHRASREEWRSPKRTDRSLR